MWARLRLWSGARDWDNTVLARLDGHAWWPVPARHVCTRQPLLLCKSRMGHHWQRILVWGRADEQDLVVELVRGGCCNQCRNEMNITRDVVCVCFCVFVVGMSWLGFGGQHYKS